MKKQHLRIFLMFSVLLILAAMSVHAQSSNRQTANIPFSFNVDGKTFSAGLYSVTRLNPQSDKAALAIKSADGNMSKVVLTVPVQAGEAQESAKLVFSRYGEEYFLSQVWTPADNTGLELPKSRAEKTLARNIKAAPERTTIALNSHRR
jgi:cytolysin (calcineurin-like family phosphatase)